MGKRNNSISTTEPLSDRWHYPEFGNLLDYIKKHKCVNVHHPKIQERYDCRNIKFRKTRLCNIEIRNADMSNIRAFEATFKNCVFKNVVFSYGDFVSTSIIDECDFENCDFYHANLSKSIISYSSFNNCSFDYSNFTNATLTRDFLEDNIFHSTDFTRIECNSISGNIGRMCNIIIDRETLLYLNDEVFKKRAINCQQSKSSTDTNLDHYDVALSFAGEDREYVNLIAHKLKENGVTIFYDNFEKAKLWGKDLIEHFSYSKKAKYVIIFCSKHYLQKAWCKIEYRSAMTRLLSGEFYSILPIVLDDVELPQILLGTGYLKKKDETTDSICDLFIEKLKSKSQSHHT